MQTFLPYADFGLSAQVLDSKRLGSQRNEALVLLSANLCGSKQWKSPSDLEWKSLVGDSAHGNEVRNTPWYNHPACVMWRGSEYQLAQYALTVCEEWRRRGFADTAQDRILQVIIDHSARHGRDSVRRAKPSWLGDPAFHASHQSNLLRKNPEHYVKYGWQVTPNIPYVYPKGAVE